MKYQHTLCLYPYYEQPTFFDFFPPAGIEHVATALKGYVGEITLIDLRVEQDYRDLSRLTQFIRQDIDLICVSVNWPFYFEQVCNFLNYLPEDIPLIVGGQYATSHVEELFRKCPQIDIIVRGEGEESIREIAQDKDLNTILGISYRKNGQIVHTPTRPLAPIETIRYPDRNLRRSSYYIHPRGIKLFDVKFDTIFSSKGCPYNCKFCTLAINPLGQRFLYSARSPESVIEEISSLNADVIYFVDDNFFVSPERIERICDLLLEKGIQKTFITQARIEIANYPPRVLKKLKKAGFKVMLIGIETPHDRILKQLNKGFSSQDVRDAFQVLKNYGFFYHCYFIYGNIGESREEMLAIARFAKEIGSDAILAQVLQARAFSPMKELIEKTPGYHITSEGFVYSDTYGIEQLKCIQKTIYRSFYSPYQVYRILRKIHKLRILPFVALPFLIRLPALLYRILGKQFRKKRGGQRVGIPYK